MSDHMLDAEQAIAKLRADNCRLVDERDGWQKRAESAERASAVDAQTVQRMTEEVHRLKDAGEQLIAECNRVSAERDAALVEVRSQLAEIRVISVDRDSAEDHNGFLREKCQKLEAERDAARAEVEGLRADLQKAVTTADILVSERDAAQKQMNEMHRRYSVLYNECENIRADLLAHPPEVHQELAIERKRHVELMEDYNRREVAIATLEEALKRAESMLKAAQGQHIDERLKGFLAVISQLADQAQDLLP